MTSYIITPQIYGWTSQIWSPPETIFGRKLRCNFLCIMHVSNIKENTTKKKRNKSGSIKKGAYKKQSSEVSVAQF